MYYDARGKVVPVQVREGVGECADLEPRRHNGAQLLASESRRPGIAHTYIPELVKIALDVLP